MNKFSVVDAFLQKFVSLQMSGLLSYLESLVSPPLDGLATFRTFLQSEFSDENIEFWMSCEDFKKTKNPVKMAAKAKKIYEDFIQSEGPREVRGSNSV